MKKDVLFIIILLSLCISLYGAGEKSGSISTLNPVPVDSGLHNLCYAESTPLESLIWNPAYAVSRNYQFGFASEILPLDMYCNSIIYIGKSPLGNNTGLGFTAKYFMSGDILKLNETGQESGTFNVNNFIGSLVFGYKIKHQYNTGFRLNFIKEKIDDNNATAFSLDIGTGYNTSLFKTQKMIIGVTILNIGTTLWQEYQSIGIAGGVLFQNSFSTRTTLEYGVSIKWLSALDYEAGPSIRYSKKIKISSNKYIQFKIGTGYCYSKSIKTNGFLNGLKPGLLMETPWNINLGYALEFYPWGNSNKFFLGYHTGL